MSLRNLPEPCIFAETQRICEVHQEGELHRQKELREPNRFYLLKACCPVWSVDLGYGQTI